MNQTENKETEQSEESTPLPKTVEELNKTLEACATVDEKVKLAMEFMEASISQKGSPNFKVFWDSRKICLELLKKDASPPIRNLMWPKFSELTKEARRLKQILDEQSVFASEQIEIAVDALEKDLEKTEDKSVSGGKLRVPKDAFSLRKNHSLYETLQNELNGLNTHASRINALRKELIKTEIRLKNKNKLFQRLSKCGDLVFPKRKELIKQISDQFIEDIENFVNKPKGEKDTVFSLKKEIKALQGFAKILTLNTQAFSKSRTLLSKSWDTMKEMEEKYKEELAGKRELFQKNAEDVMAKIEEINQYLAKDNYSATEGSKKVQDIRKYMRNIELGRDEVHLLRDKINEAEKPLKEKEQQQEQKRKDEIEKQKQRKEQTLSQIETAILEFEKDILVKNLDELSVSRETISNLLKQSDIFESERKNFEEKLDPLFDLIDQKVEEELIKNSKDDQELLANKKDVLSKQVVRRNKIKDQLEYYRKASGGSGLDFESSMRYNELIQREKERLERIEASIKELEENN